MQELLLRTRITDNIQIENQEQVLKKYCSECEFKTKQELSTVGTIIVSDQKYQPIVIDVNLPCRRLFVYVDKEAIATMVAAVSTIRKTMIIEKELRGRKVK